MGWRRQDRHEWCKGRWGANGDRGLRSATRRLRRECLDFLIPLGEEHLRRILRVWGTHDTWGRPHTSLGPGLPDRPPGLLAPPITGHRLPRDAWVVARPILGGLRHEYGLAKLAA